MRELPGERIVYFGDTGRVPYGTKSKQTIIKYVRGDIRFLRQFDPKLIIVACGTASALALPVVEREVPVPIIGVLEAAANHAVAATRNGRIGVIGTQGTIASGSYESRIAAANPAIQITSRACPLFVPLVENGHTHSEVARLVTAEYLAPIRDAGVDTLILGCTHYPLLRDVIADYMGPGVTLVDPGEQTAAFANRILTQRSMLADSIPHEGQYQFFVSDSVENFASLGSAFLEREITETLQQIEIEQYERDTNGEGIFDDPKGRPKDGG